MLRQCHAALGSPISCVKGSKRGSSDRYDTELDFSTNRLLKNSLCTPEFHWSPRLGKQEYHTQDVQIGQTSHPPTPARETRRSASKAGASEEARRTPWHLERNEHGENAVWEMTRLGAPGRGDERLLQHSFKREEKLRGMPLA